MSSTPRLFVPLVFWISVLLCMASPAVSAARAARPNIVFIFADDWGWGDLSCHGHPWAQTPNLDRLAAEGIDFHQFNVLNPVCSPSRAALITGQYPARFGIHQHFATPKANRDRSMPDWLDPRAHTLPRLLQQAGYRTAHFGKWHLTNRETHGAPLPAAYGYDEARVFNGGADWASAPLHETADNTAAFIKANAANPFFINVWIHESHTPHIPTESSMALWNKLEAQKQVYAAVLTDGDRAVGRILDALRDAGVEENTLVLFSSDNGPESNSKAKPAGKKNDPDAGVFGYDRYYSVGSSGGLRGGKRSLFEGGIRVPFLVRWPGKAPAATIDRTTPFSAVDLLPTLCAAAGVALPSDLKADGENLLPALLGKAQQRKTPLFWEWRGVRAEPDWWPRLAVREGDWKLLLDEDAQRSELHHLSRDWEESRDEARQHPEIVAHLRQLVIDWKRTLPEHPDPACIEKAAPSKPAR
jgi:arylsulfatase A-like enzyme